MNWPPDFPPVTGGGEGLGPPPGKKPKQVGARPSEAIHIPSEAAGPLASRHKVAPFAHGGKVRDTALPALFPESQVANCLSTYLGLPVAAVHAEEGGYRIVYSHVIDFASSGLDQHKIRRHRKYSDQSFIRNEDVKALFSKWISTSSTMAPMARSPTTSQPNIEAKLQSLVGPETPVTAIQEPGGWRLQFTNFTPNFSALSICKVFEHIEQPGTGFLRDTDVNFFLAFDPTSPEVAPGIERETKTREALERQLKNAGFADAKPKREAGGWRIDFGSQTPDFSALSASKIVQYKFPHGKFGFLKDADVQRFLSLRPVPLSSGVGAPSSSSAAAVSAPGTPKSVAKTKLSGQLKAESKFIKGLLQQALRGLGLPPRKISLGEGGYIVECESSLGAVAQGSVLASLLYNRILQVVPGTPPRLFVPFEHMPLVQIATLATTPLLQNTLKNNGLTASTFEIDFTNQWVTLRNCSGTIPQPFKAILYHPTGEPTNVRINFRDIATLLTPPSSSGVRGMLQSWMVDYSHNKQFIEDLKRLTKGSFEILTAQAASVEEESKKNLSELTARKEEAEKAQRTQPPTEAEIAAAKKIAEEAAQRAAVARKVAEKGQRKFPSST